MTRDAVSVVGALLPRELLDRVDRADPKLLGMKPTDYGLAPGERARDAITRSWQRLTGVWLRFRRAEEQLPASGTATSLTRVHWLLPLLEELGFSGLPLVHSLEVDNSSNSRGNSSRSTAQSTFATSRGSNNNRASSRGSSSSRGDAAASGREYAISHEWAGRVPVHLMGWRLDIDRRRRGVPGAARASPHGLVQEFLNRSDAHLWGVVSNGRVLRLLRDNASLTRQAYLEFDLEAIFDSDSFAEFALMWLCCHRTRFEGTQPQRCPLEQWSREAATAGTRARDKLREGVEAAITALGCGVLAHPANQTLRAGLRRGGALTPEDLKRQLLRIVYRVLFLLVAEARDLLHAPDADPEAKDRYQRYYSVARLRGLAQRRRGGTHSDLWAGLKVTMDALDAGDTHRQQQTRAALGLTPLGSFLWAHKAVPDLHDAHIGNAALLEAVRNLALVRDDEARLYRPVDYRNLGTEELGSVYESLLELHPEADPDARAFGFARAAGSERKTTGSYYTPSALISRLLDDALTPVINEAAAQPDPQTALLDLKVLDPACGSGHFLIAAAHRIAARLASIREGGNEPGTPELRTALREVTSRCLYGIDINPMAVELCKVSLWLEANTPGRPFGFLDHHIACGNSLLGTTPRLLAGGISDTAFKALTGDDKKHTSALRRANKTEREQRHQQTLDLAWSQSSASGFLAGELHRIDIAPDDTAEQIAAKETEYARLRASGPAVKQKLLADAWCAAFTARKTPDSPAITDRTLTALEQIPPDRTVQILWQARHNDDTPPEIAEIVRLADEYQFTHLHLTFPDIFDIPDNPEDADNQQTSWSGGFNAVIGNPPWDQIQYDPRETFAVSHPEIAEAPTMAKRNRLIKQLAADDPAIHAQYRADIRRLDGVKHFMHATGRYPLGSVGRLNTAPLFLEIMWNGITPQGRTGAIVPTGIATDSFTEGACVAIDIDSGDYEIHERDITAMNRLIKRCPIAVTFLSRVGCPAGIQTHRGQARQGPPDSRPACSRPSRQALLWAALLWAALWLPSRVLSRPSRQALCRQWARTERGRGVGGGGAAMNMMAIPGYTCVGEGRRLHSRCCVRSR